MLCIIRKTLDKLLIATGTVRMGLAQRAFLIYLIYMFRHCQGKILCML